MTSAAAFFFIEFFFKHRTIEKLIIGDNTSPMTFLKTIVENKSLFRGLKEFVVDRSIAYTMTIECMFLLKFRRSLKMLSFHCNSHEDQIKIECGKMK